MKDIRRLLTVSLANKYRPADFCDVMGQEEIVSVLENQVANNNVAQCMLMCGPAGTGKTTIARIIASHLNAEVHELDAASNNGIDFVRTMQDEANRKSMLAENKVFILDEVHGFSTQAFQALLKILEEPPVNTYFILCTTEYHKLPKTILSRVQKFMFSPLSNGEIIDRLDKVVRDECINIDDDAIEFIAEKAKGCMRDALAMLDVVSSFTGVITKKNCIDALDVVTPEVINDFVETLVYQHVNHAVRIVSDVDRDGINMKKFISDCIERAVNICKEKIENGESLGVYADVINWLVERKAELIDEENPTVMLEANIIIWCGAV